MFIPLPARGRPRGRASASEGRGRRTVKIEAQRSAAEAGADNLIYIGHNCNKYILAIIILDTNMKICYSLLRTDEEGIGDEKESQFYG